MVRPPSSDRQQQQHHQHQHQQHHSNNHHSRHSDSHKVQVARNGVVVAIVDGLPFVVGAKNKKVLVNSFYSHIPFWSRINVTNALY